MRGYSDGYERGRLVHDHRRLADQSTSVLLCSGRIAGKRPLRRRARDRLLAPSPYRPYDPASIRLITRSYLPRCFVDVRSRLSCGQASARSPLRLVTLGCVKTREAVVSAQQENRTCGVGDSFMREPRSVRINLAPERSAEWFSHSQDPERTWDRVARAISRETLPLTWLAKVGEEGTLSRHWRRHRHRHVWPSAASRIDQ